MSATASPARADRAPVTVEVDACIGEDPAAVRRALAVELGALLDDGGSAPNETTRVSVVCDGDLVLVVVDDPLTGKSLRRAIDLSREHRSGRVRLLGLAIAETVVASWIELELVPAPLTPVVDASRTSQARRQAASVVRGRLAAAGVDGIETGIRIRRPAARPAGSSWELAAGGSGRIFSSELFLAGGGLSASFEIRGRVGAAIDLLAETGAADHAWGTVDVTCLSIAPRITLRGDPGVVALEAGVGARIGYARIAGVPDDTLLAGHTLSAPWGGPIAGFALHLRPSDPLRISVLVEAGWALAGVSGRVDGADVAAVDGAFASIGLSLGIEL